MSPPILVDFQRNGRTFKGLIDVARDGYLWFLDRGDATTGGRIKFIEGKPYVYQNVFRGLDPETGRPDVDPAHKPGTGKQADYCPELHGGKNWPPIAFSPKTRMIYIPANNNMCGSSMGTEVKYVAGSSFTGVEIAPMTVRPGADHFGEVQAWNVDTGKQVWKHDYAKSPNWGSMLVTGGGVVFSGGTNDRKMHAFDATTGKLLWEFPTNSGILAPPTTFTMDGKQYLAVHAGWGGDSRGVQANLNRIFPGRISRGAGRRRGLGFRAAIRRVVKRLKLHDLGRHVGRTPSFAPGPWSGFTKHIRSRRGGRQRSLLRAAGGDRPTSRIRQRTSESGH